MVEFYETKMPETPELSFVIPCFNEEGNLLALINGGPRAVSRSSCLIVVITDDCSRTGRGNSSNILRGDPRIRASGSRSTAGSPRRCGRACRRRAAGPSFTLDADLPKRPARPAEIAVALEKFGLCLWHAVAARRQSDGFIKAGVVPDCNWCASLSRKEISDAGCCYRAFKRGASRT